MKMNYFNIMALILGLNLGLTCFSLEALFRLPPKQIRWGVAIAALAVTGKTLWNFHKKSQSKTLPIFQETDRAKKKLYANLEAKPWGKISQFYIKQLQEEEAELNKEIRALFNVTENTWAKHMELMTQKVMKGKSKSLLSEKKIPEKISKKFQYLCQGYDLNPKNIELCLVKDLGHGLSVTHHEGILRLQIDESYLNGFDEENFEASVAHEIQHIIHGDALYATILRNSRPTSNSEEFDKNIKKLLSKYDRFCENRANIFSYLMNPKYVASHIKELREDVARFGNQEYETHPSYVEQERLAHQIQTEMIQSVLVRQKA